MLYRFLVVLTLMASLLQPVPAFAQNAPEGAAGVPCEHQENENAHCPGGADCSCAQACGGLVADATVFNAPRPPAEAALALDPTHMLTAFERPPFRPPIS